MTQALTSGGLNFTQQEIAALFNAADVNKDGTVSIRVKREFDQNLADLAESKYFYFILQLLKQLSPKKIFILKKVLAPEIYY